MSSRRRRTPRRSNIAAGENSVLFSGDYVENDPTANPLQGLTNGKKASFSCFANKSTGAAGQENLFTLNNDRFALYFTANKFSCRAADDSGNIYIGQTSVLSHSIWYHICGSIDAENLNVQLYVDEVSDLSQQNSVENVVFDFAQTKATIGQYHAFNFFKYAGAISELYINLDEFIDFSVAANRRKFVTADGKPVPLGRYGSRPTGNQPAFYFNGNAQTLGNNRGYANSRFQIFGALENAQDSVR